MNKRTMMRMACRVALAMGALSIGSAVGARPGADPIYDYYYYSDAAHTAQVGYQAGACYNFGAGVDPNVQGQVTAYYERVQTGWCDHGIATWF